MMMRGRPIVPFLASLLLLALVIGVGVLAFNAGATQGAFLGLEMAPVVAGLFAVILMLIAFRLAAPLLLFPIFGMGFRRWRRFGFGRGWGRHPWKRGHFGWHAPDDRDEWIPPQLIELHRRLHEKMEAEGEDPIESSV